MDKQDLARRLGCSPDDKSIIAAIEMLQLRAQVRALSEMLGLSPDAPIGEILKAAGALKSRAALGEALEHKMADLVARRAKMDADNAEREVNFIAKRGRRFGLSVDEHSKRALLAYRKADPKAFAEDYAVPLAALRSEDAAGHSDSSTRPTPKDAA